MYPEGLPIPPAFPGPLTNYLSLSLISSNWQLQDYPGPSGIRENSPLCLPMRISDVIGILKWSFSSGWIKNTYSAYLCYLYNATFTSTSELPNIQCSHPTFNDKPHSRPAPPTQTGSDPSLPLPASVPVIVAASVNYREQGQVRRAINQGLALGTLKPSFTAALDHGDPQRHTVWTSPYLSVKYLT